MEQHKYGERERRKIQEETAFTLLWKVAAFSFVVILEMSILSHLQPNATLTVRSLTYFVLLFTTSSLLLTLMAESNTIFKLSAGLFALGILAIGVGIWLQWFIIK